MFYALYILFLFLQLYTYVDRSQIITTTIRNYLLSGVEHLCECNITVESSSISQLLMSFVNEMHEMTNDDSFHT